MKYKWVVWLLSKKRSARIIIMIYRFKGLRCTTRGRVIIIITVGQNDILIVGERKKCMPDIHSGGGGGGGSKKVGLP